MFNWIVATALCSGCCSSDVDPSVSLPVSVAAAELAPQLTTGTLVCTQGDCLAVRIYTTSSFTHVATVVIQEDGPWVYESTNGYGVRKMPFADYLTTQAPNHVLLCQPARLLTSHQADELEKYLESQLGRPYSVKHHLTGNRCDGMHCAEYATEALLRTELISVENPVRVSPASLVEGVVENGIYVAGPERDVIIEEPVVDTSELNCCQRFWAGTKYCCAVSCRKLSGWFLCR